MSVAARAALTELPGLLPHIRVVDLDQPGLQLLVGEARAAQRGLDGLIARAGARANQLAAKGRSAPAEETMRGAGAVGSRQAKKEAARAAAAEDMPGLVDAMAQGRMSGEHVDSIARHRERLPEEDRARFDTESLIDRAEGMNPETFDRLVKREADKLLADGGLKDTKAKQAASEFRHWVDRDTGMGRFTGAFDPERYETLINAIDQQVASLAAAEKGVTKDKALAARALFELVTGTGAAAATAGGGGGGSRSGRPSITVIVDHETMTHGRHDHTVCETENGHDIPTESLARLCCDATLRRVVLDERGVPIDVGRKHRTATDAQWAALKSVYSTCAWPGCEAPVSWCQAHHIHEWDYGGDTDLGNLIPLCSHHHTKVHEGHWHMKMLPDRTLELYRPDGRHDQTVPPPARTKPVEPAKPAKPVERPMRC